uniref:carbamoyl-phosphate synthase arginine-specific small subunit n=1 Tax=Pseudoerythrocladia kornmannii TaxID=753682 RepID=UPI001FCD3E30|nr:carbamoyl-phosphate synthase arginine-specific small subunit [Pseudoerythrocladia kornmannii]UNJ16677.1 carbamoyl-phosphate synthase arginine-specific small subunit [Pseudoerythrocladia kornmannii]
MNLIPALLVLADGTYYKGWSNNLSQTSIGEVVFNTGMTGYQEILTDPSYSGQIITFTYPEIGNTGINFEDTESKQVSVQGVITKCSSQKSYSWRQTTLWDNYLKKNNIISISSIDTRSLTKHLRSFGAMNGGISNEILNPRDLVDKVRQSPVMEGLDLIKENTTSVSFSWNNEFMTKWNYSCSKFPLSRKFLKVIVIDFGVKFNILRQLSFYGCSLIVVPATTSAHTICSYNPDGILLSNGPGDPSTASYAVQTIKDLLITDIPIFGICMGHQLLSKALNGLTFKLKFGHRGLNHPAGLLQKVEITSQNHGFAVDFDTSTESTELLQLTHFNLNDDTIAGLAHIEIPAFSVQYHPEASPGPHDSDYLFHYFVCLMKQRILYEN